MQRKRIERDRPSRVFRPAAQTVERCACCGSMSSSGVVVNIVSGAIAWGDQRLAVSPQMARVMALLVRGAGAIVTRTSIEGDLWGHRLDGGPDSTKTVDVYVCRLRRLLREHQAPVRIGTVWGRGFFLKARDGR